MNIQGRYLSGAETREVLSFHSLLNVCLFFKRQYLMSCRLLVNSTFVALTGKIFASKHHCFWQMRKLTLTRCALFYEIFSILSRTMNTSNCQGNRAMEKSESAEQQQQKLQNDLFNMHTMKKPSQNEMKVNMNAHNPCSTTQYIF